MERKRDASPRRILAMLPTINHPERLKLEGLLAYAHDKRGDAWHIELDLPGIGTQSDLAAFDGIVAYVTNPEMRQRVIRVRKPSVLIEDSLVPKTYPKARHVVTLLSDHESEGTTAAGYFLTRHFRHFAFLGVDTPWSESRRSGFSRELAKAGHACEAFLGTDPNALREWLSVLPKPCALLAVHDFRARQALDAALSSGIAVPDELAILGVDNDEVVCTTAAPALSSIPTFDRELGYSAGRVLNELLLRRAPGGRVIRIAHSHVVSRPSTSRDAVSDPIVARTLTWIREHLDDQLDAATLARRVCYSKHMLQIRVERALGVTLGETIRRLRTDAALDRLRYADTPVADIAAACGFTSSSHLSRLVVEATGLTPLGVRKQARSCTP